MLHNLRKRISASSGRGCGGSSDRRSSPSRGFRREWTGTVGAQASVDAHGLGVRRTSSGSTLAIPSGSSLSRRTPYGFFLKVGQIRPPASTFGINGGVLSAAQHHARWIQRHWRGLRDIRHRIGRTEL